jgi:ethanolamine ammonia-lyase small subunit
MTITAAELDALVRAVVSEVLAKPTPRVAVIDSCEEDVCAPKPAVVNRLHEPLALQRIVDDSPSRLAQGRSGTRYTTSAAITLRAEHAVAIDAVHAELDASFAAAIGCIALESRASDHKSFLLFPNLGRRLSDASVQRVLAEGSRGVDINIVVGDGLSAWAVQQQAPRLLPLLEQSLRSAGFRIGKPLFVKFARIGVADEIGVVLASKATIIMVGERPGLGTGDSLSLYTAFKPRLDQDNAEKNCISNVRPLGVNLELAASRCTELMKRTFAAGGGGVQLVKPERDVFKRVGV